MSLKTIFSDTTGNYKPIVASDWNNINRDAVYAINTRQGDFNIEIDNTDIHNPIISLNQNLDVHNITCSGSVGTTDFNATTAGIATLNVGAIANTPQLNANNILNGTLVLPNSVGGTGTFLASDGSTGTMWVAQTAGGNISNTDGNLTITSGSTGSYNINLSDNIYVSELGMTGTTGSYSLTNNSNGLTGQVLTDNGDNGNLTFNYPLSVSGNNLTLSSGATGYINNLSLNTDLLTDSIQNGTLILPNSVGLTGTILCSDGNTGTAWNSLTNTDSSLNIGLIGNNININLANTIYPANVVSNQIQLRSLYGLTGSYYLTNNSNQLAGQVLVDNGDNTPLTFKYPFSVSGGNLSLTGGTGNYINDLSLNSDLTALNSITTSNLTISGATGMTGYQMPNNVSGVPVGSSLTFTGINPMTNLGFLNFMPPTPSPTSFIYSTFGGLGALTFNNGIDNYTIPTIKFYKDGSVVNVLFDFTLGNLYIVSSPADNPAVFKTTTPVDVSLRPQTYLNLSVNNGGILTNTPPYTMTTPQSTYFSIDSSGYLYISLPFSDSWQKNKAYAMSSVSPIDMTTGIGWILSNVSCSYLL